MSLNASHTEQEHCAIYLDTLLLSQCEAASQRHASKSIHGRKRGNIPFLGYISSAIEVWDVPTTFGTGRRSTSALLATNTTCKAQADPWVRTSCVKAWGSFIGYVLSFYTCVTCRLPTPVWHVTNQSSTANKRRSSVWCPEKAVMPMIQIVAIYIY